MNKIIIFFLVLLSLSNNSTAQKPFDLQGKWKFDSVYNTKTRQAFSNEFLDIAYSELAIEFFPNNTYHFYMEGSERGKYEVDNIAKVITFTSIVNMTNRMSFDNDGEQYLILSFKENQSLRLKRIPATLKKSDEP